MTFEKNRYCFQNKRDFINQQSTFERTEEWRVSMPSELQRGGEGCTCNADWMWLNRPERLPAGTTSTPVVNLQRKENQLFIFLEYKEKNINFFLQQWLYA